MNSVQPSFAKIWGVHMKLRNRRELVRRLTTTNESKNFIAKILSISWHTVDDHETIISRDRLSWEGIKNLGDKELTSLFTSLNQPKSDKLQPDLPYLHRCMQQHHQTLIQLWDEYRRIDPERAYSYQQFTYLYREYCKNIDICMRQTWSPGDYCFVDFAGKRLYWTNPATGNKHWVEIFVGVLGYSQKIFAVALSSQSLPDWIKAHVLMFEYFGGVTKAVVPDNLKSAVTKPGSSPDINRTYMELSEHYDFVVEPARVRKPKDKSLAEIGVLIVTRWITVALRRRAFFSLEEINKAIKPLLEYVNNRNFKRYEGCRNSRFEESELYSLKPLPKKAFVFGHWISNQRVNNDYHVWIENHAYSVPYDYRGRHVDARINEDTIQLWFERKLIAIHRKSEERGGATTDENHRPLSHRAFAEQTRQFYLDWANGFCAFVTQVVSAQFSKRPEYSTTASKACTKLQSLEKQYGKDRFERACQCACEINSCTVTSIKSILQCGLDKKAEEKPIQTQLPLHHNVRGASYYKQGGA